MADWTSLRLTWEPRMLSILRIMTGLLFLEHGLNKLFNFPVSPNHALWDVSTLFSSLSPGLQGPIEVIGGLLIALGLFTRPVAFILCGEMAFAYFMAHQPRGLYPYSNGGTLAVLYCFVFLYLFVAGGGEWSLDRLRASAPASTVSPSRA